MKFANPMPAETVRTQTETEMDHASPLFSRMIPDVSRSAYDSDSGSESDGSVVISTQPEILLRPPPVYADLGLVTPTGFRKIITPEIFQAVKYTPFPNDDDILPDWTGEYFDRYSVDPKQKMNRVQFRWEDLKTKTLTQDRVDKFNAVRQSIIWRQYARAVLKLHRQEAAFEEEKPGVFVKSVQAVQFGAGMGLDVVKKGLSLGQSVIGSLGRLAQKPKTPQSEQVRKHITFGDSDHENVVKQVVVDSQSQMQVDLQAGSVCDEPSPAPPAATGTVASMAPVPTPPPQPATGKGASTAPPPPPPPKPATGKGASTGLESPAPPKPATRLRAAQETRSAQPVDQMAMMQNEMKQKLAKVKKINDAAAEKAKAETEARIKAGQEAAVYLAENRLYQQAWLDEMPYNDPEGGPCVQKLYMAHKNAKPEPHVTASGKRGKDDLIASLLLLTTEHQLTEFPWQ